MPYVRYGYHQTLTGRAHRAVRRAVRTAGRPAIVVVVTVAILLVAGGLLASPLWSTLFKPAAGPKPSPPQLYLLTDATPAAPAAKPTPPIRRLPRPERRASASPGTRAAPSPSLTPDYTGDLNAGALRPSGGEPADETAAGAAPAAGAVETPAEGSAGLGGVAPQ